MKKLFFALAAAVMAGCSSSPRVVAELTETLPERNQDSVMVYEPEAEMPESARPIGRVKVVDGGMVPPYKCLYGNMLALAVRKTAQSGGNALHVDEHRTPNFSSTCHRIWGTMYVVPDSLVDGSLYSSLQRLEDANDKVLAGMVREQSKRMERLLNNPRDILQISAGPSWITSRIVTSAGYYDSKLGFGLTADYQHLWRNGLGIGVNYMYYSTSFDEGFSVRMHYIGPSLVGSIMLGSNWRLNASLGLGYSYYKEYGDISYDTLWMQDEYSAESALGTLAQMGIEYKLSKQVGIGLQINSLLMPMKKPDDYYLDYNFYGIKRTDVLIGLRYYL